MVTWDLERKGIRHRKEHAAVAQCHEQHSGALYAIYMYIIYINISYIKYIKPGGYVSGMCKDYKAQVACCNA